MTTIWKASLAVADEQEIEVPRGAELLFAREQGDCLAVWFRCDPSAPKETRTIAIVGTGHVAPGKDCSRYLGSGVLLNGRLVFHVFEKLN
jgi:hypothetical protein